MNELLFPTVEIDKLRVINQRNVYFSFRISPIITAEPASVIMKHVHKYVSAVNVYVCFCFLQLSELFVLASLLACLPGWLVGWLVVHRINSLIESKPHVHSGVFNNAHLFHYCTICLLYYLCNFYVTVHISEVYSW